MAKSINTDRIIKDFDKAEISEVKVAYYKIKEYVNKRLVEYQKKLVDESSDIQDTIQKL